MLSTQHQYYLILFPSRESHLQIHHKMHSCGLTRVLRNLLRVIYATLVTFHLATKTPGVFKIGVHFVFTSEEQ